MASQKQIGAELGISYTLVSKVLSGRMGTTGVSPALRNAIIRKAKELDYRPNPLAVALKRGRKGAIGVFIHAMGVPGSELAHEFLKSVSYGLSKSGARLVLRHFQTDEEFISAVDAGLRHEVDGLIVGGCSHPGLVDRLEQMDANGCPIVYVASGVPRRTIGATITVDYEMQGFLATAHLLDQGCRRLAQFTTLESRAHGFARAHQERCLPTFQELMILPEDFTVMGGVKAMQGILERQVKFDGVVAQSDAQAIGAMRVLARAGLRVPEDVRVTGVDNCPLCDATNVPITSVTAEMEECGRVAVEMLNDKLAGRPVDRTIIGPHLVVRESSR